MADYPFATFRIELGPGRRLGPGKVRLLEQIGHFGSISAAAREMGMSYRRAWLLVEESNALFADPLVESTAGGPGGGGAKLTELGERTVSAYRQIEREAAALVNKRLSAIPEFGNTARSSRKT